MVFSFVTRVAEVPFHTATASMRHSSQAGAGSSPPCLRADSKRGWKELLLPTYLRHSYRNEQPRKQRGRAWGKCSVPSPEQSSGLGGEGKSASSRHRNGHITAGELKLYHRSTAP